MKRAIAIIICTVILAAVVILMISSFNKHIDMPTNKSSGLILTSSAFKEGGNIPREYTCDGENKSIPLEIAGVPSGTASFVLTLEDPDVPSGTFDHWILYDIPAETRSIAEEMPKTTATTGIPGKNSAGTTEYVGPCPPTGTHRYIFTLYALDSKLSLPPASAKSDVLQAAQGHVIGEARLMGRYGRL